MSASRKFDISSSPDRPLYASGHRGSFGTASLDRSGSFRENLENPLLSSLPSMTRSNASVTQNDVVNFFHCVRVDPKSMVIDHKLNRPADFKRLASAAVGMPLEDFLPSSSKSKHLTSPALDDLRRLKSGVRESGTKARERVKIFNDCLSVVNKCFPAIPSRKRSRLDALSIDRSASGVGIGKKGLQNHAISSGFELEQQKSEGRIKNAIPSKRTRTSMADARMEARANILARPPATMDKDKDAVRISSSNSVQGEDQTMSIAVDGWEISKMKKKRTGKKVDNAGSSMKTKAVDGYREPKQGTHLRLIPEARSRVADAYGFRSGATNGGVGLGKSEATSQTSSGMRSSMSRTDSENSSVLHERRERSNGQEKERMNLKAVNKANSREDISCSSPTSGSKSNANVRAPRSVLVGGVSKMSQAVQRSVSSNDWDLSNCTNKVTGGLGASSRKRTPSARPSSPVASWAQRPQKISRTARRTTLLPAVSGNDEDPIMEAASSDMVVNERRFPAHTPKQAKIKGDNISPAALSESEGSGAAEIKSRNKNNKSDALDEKGVKNVQKISALLLPPRKNKAVNTGDRGDSVRRQGRTGRGFTSSRSLLPLSVEKHGNVGNTKQIRSSRLGLDKTESRAGRPPTRKLSDRKAYTRQKHITINTGADFLVGADDGHEELLAAANAVTDTAQALSSPFWKKMEPLFHFITDVNISYLKDQINSGTAVDAPAPVPLDTVSCISAPDCGSNEFGRGETEARSVELSSEHVAPGMEKPDEISMYQRLIAALIPEEEDESEYDVHESSFEIEKDFGSNSFCSHTSPSCDPSGCPTFYGYDVNSNGRPCYKLEKNIMPISGTGFSSCDHLQNGLHTNQSIPSTICSEYQYQNMSVNERLIMEVHSIGIYPDLVSGDEISGDITKLDEKYEEQASRKKSLLGKLLCSATDAKELQQKEFEGRALSKLVGMGYEKYMSCCGPNAHGMKSASGKMAKQAALAFVKRTMERYREFEETGKSCFDDPLYKDIFLSGVSCLVDGQPLNSSTSNESGKLHLGESGFSVKARTSAPLGAHQCPSSTNQDLYSSELFTSNNLGSDEVTGNEDSWSNRGKMREVLLDNVGGIISNGLGGSLSCSAKGKRSERDREGKGNNRESFPKNGTTKISRTVSASVKGDRKSKARPKHKTAHLSASVNCSLGNMGEQTKGIFSATLKSSENSQSNFGKDENNYSNDILEEPIDLSGLQLPDMDDLGGNGEDLGSWLMNIDDGLHDNDCIGGLGIPMDDLAGLNMMI
ncbi:uncharacterized protein LOC121796265 isoform X1 [Salvia splendens]|uniref:uncharacterized protein LOC121796265 isoform X1 n=1 Tax=Salvia splendens TaxID=180675 RepID=UPI001C2789F8|nr:uncharacterized protein LOC121796265 isoform X1 [Salvia splendens]XP_042051002.1 uncharacterized protein LOC121796265 isoform X1 [Salvia splendens]XP_042051003.1 uncharacterized protein LOC121796265 isoform X1 [Salvia splendens]